MKLSTDAIQLIVILIVLIGPISALIYVTLRKIDRKLFALQDQNNILLESSLEIAKVILNNGDKPASNIPPAAAAPAAPVTKLAKGSPEAKAAMDHARAAWIEKVRKQKEEKAAQEAEVNKQQKIAELEKQLAEMKSK